MKKKQKTSAADQKIINRIWKIRRTGTFYDWDKVKGKLNVSG